MAFFLRLLGSLPLPMLYWLGRLAKFVAYDLMRWHVPLAAGNVARSLPERSDAEREAILEQSYRNLGAVVAEGVWGWRATGEALRARVAIDNRALVDRYIAEKRPVVLLAAHMCNWEWLALAAGAELGIPICSVYKTLRVPSVDVYVREARARFGGQPIPIDRLLFELMRADDQPRAYAMLADQTPPKESAKHWRRFLHQDTAFYAGLGKVAQWLDAPVIYVAMRRLERGRYAAHLTVIAEPPYDADPETQIVDRYGERLEAEIRANPADFLWVHKKWKYPKPPGLAGAFDPGLRKAL
jgi:KDO2-lipid IV(A) lauroyltransferase